MRLVWFFLGADVLLLGLIFTSSKVYDVRPDCTNRVVVTHIEAGISGNLASLRRFRRNLNSLLGRLGCNRLWYHLLLYAGRLFNYALPDRLRLVEFWVRRLAAFLLHVSVLLPARRCQTRIER